MLNFKNTLIVLGLSLLTVSCSQYQKVLSKGSTSEKYQMATDLYAAEKYTKALRLLEQVSSAYRGKPQMERIQFMVANAYYKTKDYNSAGYYFGRFTANYPKSTKNEEARFLGAKSKYLDTPKYSLDQTNTYDAMQSLQTFVNDFPYSDYSDQVNKMTAELQYKLEKKAFEIATQYYKIGYFNSAITALENFNSEFLGSSFKEEAVFISFKAGYELGIRSALVKKAQRIDDAIKIYEKFVKKFPTSEFKEEATKLYDKLLLEKTTLNS